MAAWMIISGSPYAQGKCSRAARNIAASLNALDTSTSASLYSVSELVVQGCIGCDSCKQDLNCIYEDDQEALMHAVDAAEAVAIIAPLYFAGVPSQFKAVLDRFQPYFWKRERIIAATGSLPPKRTLVCALVGEGGDPYGSNHAFPQIASPFALADYRLTSSRTFIDQDLATIESVLLEDILRLNEEIGS